MTLAALLAAIVPCSGDKDGSPLAVAANGRSVTVEGVQPGANVIVVGLIRRSVGAVPARERWTGLVVDGDGDGTVTVLLEEEFSADHSVWVAVDTSSMGWAMAQPVIGGVPLTPPAEGELRPGEADWPIPAAKAEVMAGRQNDLVGPGIWAGRVFDQGTGDEEPVKGAVAIAPGLLEPAGGSGLPFGSFSTEDLLIAIEPETFQVWVARVEEEEQ